MLVDTSKKILIVGLGLMGGSYAMALKKYGFKISAITRNPKTIEYALGNNLIDFGYTEVKEEVVSEADLIIFGLYPHVFLEWLSKYGKWIKKSALVTDVTGVKRSVVYKAQEILDGGAEFISAHPMAGRETCGVENSSDKIFIGANYIVTPTEKNTKQAIEECKELGRLLGFSNVVCISPEEHDDVIGFVSQLTHCIAITLMTCNDKVGLENFTGDSFRDLTRIARINDEMWSELFLANKLPLLKQMDAFMAKFNELKTMIATDDREQMRELMRYSTERRALFDKKN
ncbi:MAG: prephenate dehydrogenase [Clostridia bacterium]|nr:prephenate dehydrogenase [Clostridia bacterium]